MILLDEDSLRMIIDKTSGAHGCDSHGAPQPFTAYFPKNRKSTANGS